MSPEFERLTRLSRYGARLIAAYPALAGLDVSAPFARPAMQAFLAAEPITDEAALHARLRMLRQRVWAVTTARDLAGLADLSEVMATWSTLAELCIQTAATFHVEALAHRHGTPRDAEGHAQTLIVVAMGKLGGGELNVSSDIDLVCLYPEEGETDGTRPISNHEFFVRLTRRLSATLAENTADGFVFRVDLRLRPWGDSGPLAMSLAMLEDYLVAHGRPWERYAWIKARAVTGAAALLDPVVRPFVYRKYLDFEAFAAIRDLHVQIRREVARKEREDDVKLGPGGIREIEFIAQVFQLIRGGQLPQLRQRPTLSVLAALRETGLLTPEAVDELVRAYDFLRRLEHRIQYLDDAQTQRLPTDSESQSRLAEAMGFGDHAALLTALDQHRARVTRHFEQVFAAPQADQTSHPLAAACCGLIDRDAACARLAAAGFADPAGLVARIEALRMAPAVSDSTRLRLDALLPPAIELIGQMPQADPVFARFAAFIERIVRRATYLALLAEYPAALRQLVKLMAASPWAAELLTRQPQLLDELIAPAHLMAAPDWPALADELAAQMTRLAGDTEAQMDAMRRFKQAQTLRLLAQDVAGRLTVEALSDHLAALADLLLAETLAHCWNQLKTRHRDAPQFAVIAYGKLGGKELGYASDLDLVFLYDDEAPDAQAIYARLAQRMNTWLATTTPAGVLYETDLRLRPDGASGLLVSALDAFAQYQQTHAWTWEHQALTRARFVCGEAAIGTRFEQIRRQVIGQRRDQAALRAEVLAMRQKMHDGHPNASGDFDLKHDPGGLVDVEFAVQFIVLAQAHAHPALLDNAGNIALLSRAAEAGLLPARIAADAAEAYRVLRRTQHAVKLAGAEHARVPADALAPERAAVRALWDQVFSGG